MSVCAKKFLKKNYPPFKSGIFNTSGPLGLPAKTPFLFLAVQNLGCLLVISLSIFTLSPFSQTVRKRFVCFPNNDFQHLSLTCNHIFTHPSNSEHLANESAFLWHSKCENKPFLSIRMSWRWCFYLLIYMQKKKKMCSLLKPPPSPRVWISILCTNLSFC